MKKFFTFAIMALLIGGFAFNTSAQDKKPVKTSKKSVKQEVKQTQQNKKEVKGEDWNKVLKEYEQAVDNCVTIFQKDAEERHYRKKTSPRSSTPL
jgi:hypothetical protein